MGAGVSRGGWVSRAVQAWRTLLEREDARWRAAAGATAVSDEKPVCDSAPKTPTLADLVQQRASEVRHDRGR